MKENKLNKFRSVKENRIYIRGEFPRKKCKTAILLYCFHAAGVKLLLKENQIMK